MALWQTGGLLARAHGWMVGADDSPFADSEPDVRPEGERDGDNSEAQRKVEHPEHPSG